MTTKTIKIIYRALATIFMAFGVFEHIVGNDTVEAIYWLVFCLCFLIAGKFYVED